MGHRELHEEIKTIIGRFNRPEKGLVTGGMPYANGPLHVGHLAGAHIPADVYSRFLKMLIGEDNVLFVCGTDDHGSTSEVSARKAGKDVKSFIGEIHEKQNETLSNYSINMDVYTGTSREENFETHKEYCQDFLRELFNNEMLSKKTSKQWFDEDMKLFLPDRYINGECPSCGYKKAYSDECDSCGTTYKPEELLAPISTLSGTAPVLKDTDHWWLDMWQVVDQLKTWIESKGKTWRKSVLNETLQTVTPGIIFSNKDEPVFKELREKLPKHKTRYAPGKKIVVQFDNLTDLKTGKNLLADNSIESDLMDEWAHRSITRDIKWGIPLPQEIDPEMKDKSFYVWSESLVAPIAFTQLALKNKGKDPNEYAAYWKNPKAKIAQFIGVDNIFFYVVMQGALWFGTQKDKFRMPIEGELQLTDVYPVYHLQINDEKMSKSTGNFYTGDQLIGELGHSPDQIRYFLSLLSLNKKQSNFDFDMLKDRNHFLAGPMNAALEKPISACISKFDGKVPEGDLIGKTEKETKKMIQIYMKSMEKAETSDLLYLLENYARLINKLFTQFKPHDDRCDEKERADALFSCFYILKNLMIMLYPIVPTTMDKVRQSLNLPESIFNIDELGVAIEPGHTVGQLQEFFPPSDLVE